MATIKLRLAGATPLHLGAAAVAAFPFGYTLAQSALRHVVVAPSLLALSAAAALLPWLSRALARASCRATCDEVAVHFRGEALPYRTLTEVSVSRTARRATLRLRRGETATIDLVLWDAFAGRLQPLDELARRLAAHGHPIP